MTEDVVHCRNCESKNRLGTPLPGQVPRCGRCQSPLPWLVATTDADFDRDVDAPVPVVVDFWAPWCAPCVRLAPVLKELTADFAGRLKTVKLNTQDNPLTGPRFRVQGIPMLVLIRAGEVVDTLVGLRKKSELEQWVSPHLEG